MAVSEEVGHDCFEYVIRSKVVISSPRLAVPVGGDCVPEQCEDDGFGNPPRA